MDTTWDRVLAWRLRRQFLAGRDGPDVPAVARRLAGVQAQVPTSAACAVAVRRREGSAEQQGVDEALRAGALVRTWAMRGTLHLLAADQAPALLALLASARSWHKSTWQREWATLAQMDALADAARAVLADDVARSRDELVDALVEHTCDPDTREKLRSGWGTLLKPLAWQGLLIQGPPDGNRVTFTRPTWPDAPDVDTAARAVVPAYLSAYGPASPETFDAWLLRGMTPKARLRGWFAELVDDGVLATIDVEGTGVYARAADLDELAGARPVDGLRLVGGFDQYILGPGTGDERIVPAAHRARVSRPGGWITPVVLDGGRVVATWSVDGDRLVVEPFGPGIDPAALEPERAVWSRVLGRPLVSAVWHR